MKVNITVHTGAPLGNERGWLTPGQVVDLPDDVAAEYLKRGWAVPVAIETTEAPGAPETAVIRKGRAKN